MRFFDHLLIDALQGYEGIVMYGAGWFASGLYPILCQHALDQKIICFAVSSSDQNEKFGKHEIKEIDKIECDKDKVAVLVSASAQFQDSMASRARSAGFVHIISATDHIRSNENMLRLYQGMDYDCFVDSIQKKYLCDHPEAGSDGADIRTRSLERQDGQDYDPGQVVWISGNPTPRSIKMIRALKRKGLGIVVILYGRRCKQIFLREIQDAGIAYVECGDEEEMMLHALRYRPLLYYYEPKWGNCIWFRIMMQYKAYLRPLVLGLYDVLNDAYVIDDQILLGSERYALENADGIVWRWFSKEYLEEKKGFRFNGRSMQFHDHCGGYVQRERRPDSEQGDLLRLCCVNGSYWDFSQEGDMAEGYETYSSLKEIAAVLSAKKGCILDIYIGKYDQKAFEDSKAIEDAFPEIRFFWNVPHEEMIDRLQDHDYACEFYNTGKINPMDRIIQCGANTYYGSVFRNGVSNRFFDYLDAGLPIVTSVSLKQVDLLSSYGVIVKMSLQELDIDYLKDNKTRSKRRAMEARKKLEIDRHIDDLIDFFNSFNDRVNDRA